MGKPRFPQCLLRFLDCINWEKKYFEVTQPLLFGTCLSWEIGVRTWRRRGAVAPVLSPKPLGGGGLEGSMGTCQYRLPALPFPPHVLWEARPAPITSSPLAPDKLPKLCGPSFRREAASPVMSGSPLAWNIPLTPGAHTPHHCFTRRGRRPLGKAGCAFRPSRTHKAALAVSS